MSPASGFQSLGIAPKLLDVLAKQKFTEPTPIQKQSIPLAIEGKDIIGIAQTGTGKTLAFGIPMLQRLAREGGQGLVIAPTRELAVQIEESLKKVGGYFGLKTAVLIGGEAFGNQLRRLRVRPHIIVATPGRLIDHIERRTVRLETIAIVVLDEADRMLDMGFMPQIKAIFEKLPPKRQTLLFSATMPAKIVSLAGTYMQMPVRVEVAPAGSTAKDVSQEVFFVEKPNKLLLLESLLTEYRGSILIFTRTKHEAKKISRLIKDNGHKAAEIHSNRSLAQRREALEGFKIGRYRILVATDIAARGIDVSGIELVLNFDLPENAEDYVHRIGRTGRAGAVGHAISFAMPHQRNDVANIERLIKKALPLRKSEHSLSVAPAAPRPPMHGRKKQFSSSRNFRSTRAASSPNRSAPPPRSYSPSSRPASRPSRPSFSSRPTSASSSRASRPSFASRPSSSPSRSARPQQNKFSRPGAGPRAFKRKSSREVYKKR